MRSTINNAKVRAHLSLFTSRFTSHLTPQLQKGTSQLCFWHSSRHISKEFHVKVDVINQLQLCHNARQSPLNSKYVSPCFSSTLFVTRHVPNRVLRQVTCYITLHVIYLVTRLTFLLRVPLDNAQLKLFNETKF